MAQVRQLTENGVEGGFSWLKAVGYGGLRIVTSPRQPDLLGKNIERLAKERGVGGFDLLAGLVMKHDAVRLTMADIDENDIRLILVQPWTMIGSDGNGIDTGHDPLVCEHPRSLGIGDFVMMVSVKDVADYEAFARKFFFENRNVERFETLVVMSCAKFDVSVKASLAPEK